MKTNILFCLLALFGRVDSLMAQNTAYGNLLYQGTYTATGVVRNSTSISGCGQVNIDFFYIYEKALLRKSNSEVFPYLGDVIVYGESGRRYGNNQVFYLVTNQGMIRFVACTNNDILVLYLDKGDTRSNYIGKIFSTPLNNGGNSGGGYGNNGGNYSNQQRQRSCSHCHGTGLCPTCNGTGWVVNSFGIGGQSPCVNCNRNGGRVNNPNRGKCPSCGGNGKR